MPAAFICWIKGSCDNHGVAKEVHGTEPVTLIRIALVVVDALTGQFAEIQAVPVHRIADLVGQALGDKIGEIMLGRRFADRLVIDQRDTVCVKENIIEPDVAMGDDQGAVMDLVQQAIDVVRQGCPDFEQFFIEKLAELIQTKKIPILADVRDESADDIRVILEPKSKNVDPDVLMGMLFRNSDLEVRFSLNMNVLIDGLTPKVCGLKEILQAFLDHRREVLLRRSKHRIDKIDHRLEVLEGLLVAFLNLDRVIDIIRYDEDPKLALLCEDWTKSYARAMNEADYLPPDKTEPGELSEVQVEAILNMRLRSLRRLEEMELTRERDALMEERAGIQDILDNETLQWDKLAEQIKDTKKKFGKDYEGGARRTSFAEAGVIEEVPLEAMIEKEPVTIVCSQMGWIRAMSGHIDLTRELKFKDGDGPKFIFHAETTDKVLVFASNGRFYTLAPASLPGGRGMGEPLRLIVDIPNDADIVDIFVSRPDRKLLVASSAGDGFIVSEEEVIAQTRAGKQVLNVKGDVKAQVCKPVMGDHVAVVGENRKVLIFPLSELPELSRGKGVRLQKYKDGVMNDATTFDLSGGLSWLDPAGRTRTETELGEWIAKRASAGRMAPRGFPRDNKFG